MSKKNVQKTCPAVNFTAQRQIYGYQRVLPCTCQHLKKRSLNTLQVAESLGDETRTTDTNTLCFNLPPNCHMLALKWLPGNSN